KARLPLFPRTLLSKGIVKADGAIMFQAKEIPDTCTKARDQPEIVFFGERTPGSRKADNAEAGHEAVAEFGLCCSIVLILVTSQVIAAHSHVFPKIAVGVERDIFSEGTPLKHLAGQRKRTGQLPETADISFPLASRKIVPSPKAGCVRIFQPGV